jgi:uncharacterized protein (TIGR02246 family)
MARERGRTGADRAAEEVEALYRAILGAWNQRSAARFSGCFAADGSMVGFDGSGIEGAASIAEHLGAIFADHDPARYVAVVREVRSLGAEATILRAVAGMVPPGATEPEPELNTVHVLVAVPRADGWRAAHFQSTPARYDGRPDAAAALTAELSGLAPD